ncbi:hypothetical protein DHW03_01155 [Pedobacter yonginense]|jgi:hypothetical protein|uniref:Uncharacterized protein n=1 Tax=Pedobacter yonginense TaxID=651869 RepID=A0A317EQT2_9SPHI|nr:MULTISPECIES: RES domain-containing protein [Pedobacter]PWS28497.1 hypothetical protein DHW03_01155 [Pedobacter yonginense]
MTIQNVQKAIDKLEAIDPNDEFAYEKAFMAYKIIQQLPILIYDIHDNIEVFRARTHFEDVFYTSKNDISLAPHEAIKSFARCNRPYQSKFYCAENRPTSYLELVDYWSKEKEIDENLYVTIGRWIVKRPFTTLIITSPDAENRASKFDLQHGPVLDDFINQYDGEFKEANILFYRFLFERFRKSGKEDPLTYLITSAYCNIALFELPMNVDAIYYPSVPFDGQGVNFAFNNRFINDNNIELISALRDEFKVYRVENDKKDFRQINEFESRKVENGIITW